jgi:hypothetical protein
VDDNGDALHRPYVPFLEGVVIVPTPVFVSYSHRNTAEKEALCKGLTALPQIALWTDSGIEPGDEWEKKIETALSDARLAILLVTNDFLNSTFVKSKELPRILERQRGEGVRVVPIIARPCPWNLHEWLHRLQVLPEGGKPIWPRKKDAVDKLLNEIVVTIGGLMIREVPEPPEPPKPPGDGAPPRESQDTAAHVRKIAGGLDELAVLRTSPVVDDTITSFREDFRVASAKIELVRHFKRLHDELHTIHNYYRQLTDNIRWFPEEASVLRLFSTVHADLEASVFELKQIQQEAPQGGTPATWIRSVEDATARLASGIDGSALPPVTAAIDSLRRVLSQEPGRLDSRMNSAARDIKVEKLVIALRRVRDAVSVSSPDNRMGERFAEGLASLEALEHQWSALIELHRGWEEVEATQRLIDESIGDAGDGDGTGDDLRELRVQFEFISEAIATLVLSDEGDWVARLRTVHGDLSVALEQRDDAAARKRYMLFRSLTGRRFKNLDTQLKETCGDLSQLGKRLESLAV